MRFSKCKGDSSPLTKETARLVAQNDTFFSIVHRNVTFSEVGFSFLQNIKQKIATRIPTVAILVAILSLPVSSHKSLLSALGLVRNRHDKFS